MYSKSLTLPQSLLTVLLLRTNTHLITACVFLGLPSTARTAAMSSEPACTRNIPYKRTQQHTRQNAATTSHNARSQGRLYLVQAPHPGGSGIVLEQHLLFALGRLQHFLSGRHCHKNPANVMKSISLTYRYANAQRYTLPFLYTMQTHVYLTALKQR